MSHTLRWSWMLGMVAVAAGCSGTNVSVAAKHGAVNNYQASVGNLNTPNFALGDVVVLDPQTKQATKVASAQVEPIDVTFTATAPGVAEPFFSGFELSYSQKVQPYMQEEVEAAVRSHTTLHVEQYFERKLTNPASFAVRNPQLASTISKFRTFQPEAKFFLVSSVVPAQKVYLSFSDSQEAVKVGKYTFHVQYDQNGQLERMSKDQPAFFRLTPLTVETRDGRAFAVVDKDFHENLPDYRVNSAVARTE
jgi:hypothetical protein